MSAVVRKVGALPVLDEASRTMTLYPRTIPLSSLHGDECCGASSSPRSAVRQLHAVAHSVNSVDGKRRPATIWEWGRRGSSGELVPEPPSNPQCSRPVTQCSRPVVAA